MSKVTLQSLNWKRVLVLLLLLVVFGPPLLRHSALQSNFYFTDDVQQQIWPFLKYYNQNLFGGDYIAEYYLNCFPLGYWSLYAGWSKLADPYLLSRWLPYLLLLITIVAAAQAASRFEGFAAGVCTAALLLSSPIYLERMVGGLPRAFAFPLIALVIAAVVHGRVKYLMLLTVLSALFYPSCAVFSAVVLMALLFIPGRYCESDISNWTLSRKLAALLATGMLTLLCVVPTLLNSKQYGGLIRSNAVEEFPELGENGRYGVQDREPWPRVLASMQKNSLKSLSGAGDKIIPLVKDNLNSEQAARILLAIAALLTLIFGWRDRKLQRFLLLFAISALIYKAAVIVSPYLYLPERYLHYSIPLLTAILVAAMFVRASRILTARIPNDKLSAALYTGLVTLALVAVIRRGAPDAGLNVHITGKQRDVLEYISKLSPQARIAGFPSGLANAIPFSSKRSVLASYETHQAFHRRYALEMRARVNLLLDAYYSANKEALLDLVSRYQVTHVLLERHFIQTIPVKYFEPFNTRLLKHRDSWRSVIRRWRTTGAAKQIYYNSDFAIFEISQAVHSSRPTRTL